MTALIKLTEKYLAEQSKLDELIAAESEANTNLQSLENNTELDFETVQKQSSKLNLAIQKAQFERRAITVRLSKLESELKAATAEADQDFAESEREVVRQRRAVYESAVKSEKWQAIRTELWALTLLQGGYYETVARELLGRVPDSADQREAVQELDMWIPDPVEPDELFAAKQLVGHKEKSRYLA